MEWTDQAIILSVRRHGESSAILSLLTREHGRHAGLVKGGMGKGARGSLQPGNRIHVTWKARLSEHLGQITWELDAATGTRWLDDRGRLAAVVAACARAEKALPERAPHPAAFDALAALLEHLGAESYDSLCCFWELGLLAEIGYGLDLSCCAATGSTEDLIYVSPKSGRAVSRTAGEPYKDRLLPLPRFLLTREAGTAEEITQAREMLAAFWRK